VPLGNFTPLREKKRKNSLNGERKVSIEAGLLGRNKAPAAGSIRNYRK